MSNNIIIIVVVLIAIVLVGLFAYEKGYLTGNNDQGGIKINLPIGSTSPKPQGGY